MARINAVLKQAAENRVSDIHFSSGEAVWVRLDGDLVTYSENPMSHEDLESMLLEILSEAEAEKLKKNLNLDKSYFVEGVGNFRVNIFYSRRGIGSVIRTLPSKIPTIEELGLPAIVKNLAELPKGLILVTGPTGSGKSTTLAAIINHMNANFPYHILTAEDPVEFIHVSKKSLINQREIGQSCPTFADALKYALREDPDVILVGEMRDLETISLALTAAETGHLVLGTLHTRGAAPTIDRVIESFPAMQQAMVRAMLAESLQGVISQTLIKKASGKGRVAAYEIMVMNYAISNLVREGKTFQISSAMQTGRKEGMIQMEAHVKELAASGEISENDAEELLASLTRGGHSGKGNASPAVGKTPGLPPQQPVPKATKVEAPAVSPAPPVAPPRTETSLPPAAPISASQPPPTARKVPAPVPARPVPSVPAPAPVAAAAAQPAPIPTDDLISLDDLGSQVTDLANLEVMAVPSAPPVVPGIPPAVKFKPLGASGTDLKPPPRPIPTMPAKPAAATPAVKSPPPPPTPPPIKKTG
jgi:twitching motility protein PilT